MRYIILLICLLVIFPTFANAEENEWKWIITCDIFSQELRRSIEIFRETYSLEPGVYSNSVIFRAGPNQNIIYFEWGLSRCKMMKREIFESLER